jgi:L-cysteine desulfidase
MIDKEIREQIIALVHKEVVPAIGCTEPMAVALCTTLQRLHRWRRYVL